jgi:hypothetical protein
MCVLRGRGAGQGAHRKVGSEGFAATCRAVAEQGEPVGQIQMLPSRHYDGEGNTWGVWAQQGVCGRHGREGTHVTSGGLVRSRSTEQETWAYKFPHEVAREAVREVGVTHGTHEPRNNMKPRDRLAAEATGGDSKGADQGEGVTSGMVNSTVECGRVGVSVLMVAEAMTETRIPRSRPRACIPTKPGEQAR